MKNISNKHLNFVKRNEIGAESLEILGEFIKDSKNLNHLELGIGW